MTKESKNCIRRSGIVLEVFKNDRFDVKLDDGSNHIVRCVLCGKIRQNYIRIIPGDKVWIDISIYDLSNGRIMERIRDKRQSTQPANNSKSKSKSKKK